MKIVTLNKKGFSLCKIYIYMIKYDLDISSTSLKWHTTQVVIIQQKAIGWICYSTNVPNMLHTDTLFPCMIVTDMRTCNSLIWCYSYVVMFDILCYSYWWSTNIWRGLMTLSQHQPTEQHTAIHTCTKAHKS